ncbi:MAG: DUF4382 domain-containing protein [Gemmatimonadetes bacterium]|nr:DUF4382 domain-containing protein [Gemmatimonadota bacterium]
MTSKTRFLALTAALAMSGAIACDETTGAGGDATLRVLLTDAPTDYISAAWVDIGAVELLSEEGRPITLTTDGTDGLVNLLDLQNAATETLAEAEIEPGTYHQLRLIVESARVQLADGFTFTNGSTEKDLFVPSGAQTGIKLNLGAADGEEDGAGLEIVPGEMVLVLDFDVSQSFVMQGNAESPAGIKGFIFTPTIRVTVNDVAASISGAVSTALEGVSVKDLTVTAEPVEGSTLEQFQSGTATAVTDENGAYTLHFLVPGTYTVTVTAGEAHKTTPESHSVTVGPADDAEAVNFEIVAR